MLQSTRPCLGTCARFLPFPVTLCKQAPRRYSTMSKNATLSKTTTLNTLIDMKEKSQPITMVTSVDATSSSIIIENEAADIILVGDSVANTSLGYKDTTQVTMDEMIHHCKAVNRGLEAALNEHLHSMVESHADSVEVQTVQRPKQLQVPFVVGDMPFGSYSISTELALENAIRFIKEGKTAGVKLEGASDSTVTAVSAITQAGVPAMGHIGLTPQTYHAQSGYKVQGRDHLRALQLLEEAIILEGAGCFALVLECVPEKIAMHISEELSIPTIGIGSGRGCDAQVLVWHDILGLGSFKPRFAKQYMNGREAMGTAVAQYAKEVRQREFPEEKHAFKMPKKEFIEFGTKAQACAAAIRGGQKFRENVTEGRSDSPSGDDWGLSRKALQLAQKWKRSLHK